MGIHRKTMLEKVTNFRNSLKEQTKNKDLEKIYYLYFDRLFSMEEIESHFKGKYTYIEIRDIIKNYYKEYYKRENENGR